MRKRSSLTNDVSFAIYYTVSGVRINYNIHLSPRLLPQSSYWGEICEECQPDIYYDWATFGVPGIG